MNEPVVHNPPRGQRPEELVRDWKRGLLTTHDLIEQLMAEIERLREKGAAAQTLADAALFSWLN